MIDDDQALEIVEAVDMDGNHTIDYWDFLIAVVDCQDHHPNKRLGKFVNTCKKIYDYFFRDKGG